MKYLFFDIECANSFDGICKMCSFGYAIFDNKFNKIESKDILMDPEDDFDWYLIKKKNGKAKLAYAPEFFRMFDSFPYQYNEIRRILTQEYGAIFGYAVNNDLKYIRDATTRYNLNPINVEAYDLKKMLKEYDNISKGLANALKELTDKEHPELVNHNSEHDAIMTAKLLENLCKQMETNINGYLELTEVKPTKHDDALKKKQKVKQIPKPKKPENPELRAKNDLFNTYYDKKNDNPTNLKYDSLMYSVSVIIKMDIDLALKLVTHLHEGGGVMNRSLWDSEILIVFDEEDKERLEKIVDLTKIKLVLIYEFIKNNN